MDETIYLRPYTVKQLAAIYGVSKKTFRKWVKPFSEEIGYRNGHFYSVLQLKVIISKLGAPGC